ncbi:MAG: hypothetical protein KF774_14265 [Planctomyces sp.]|nr:hypothetical protein [Planctomyces sp.]
MAFTRRGVLAGAAAGLLGATTLKAQEATAPAPGAINEDQLGELLQAIGLKPDKQQQRYDFAFAATLDEQKWELSMSAVLSQDAQSVWVMAWLDECPKAAADVPRTALLRLLAENDKLGSGKFFAYIPNNRRFVLQRVVANEDMTSAKFKMILQDLGTTVVETYPTWSVAGWNATAAPAAGATADAAAPANAAGPANPASPSANATRAAANDSKFQAPVKK